jgi:uncharacterized membrane protein
LLSSHFLNAVTAGAASLPNIKLVAMGKAISFIIAVLMVSHIIVGQKVRANASKQNALRPISEKRR